MTTTVRIYFDFLINLFILLWELAIVKTVKSTSLPRKWIILFLFLQIIYSIPSHIPYNTVVSMVLTLFEITILCYPNVKHIVKIFIISELGIHLISFFIGIIQSVLLGDFYVVAENSYYLYCKSLISTSLVYIFFMLYINFKRMEKFRTYYHYVFTAVIVLIIFALCYITLYICKTETLTSAVIPVFFSIIYILIAAFLIIYQKFIDLLEENLQSHIQLEQTKMTCEYSDQIEANLKELHSLRHDIRNHLLTIDGYASHQNYDRIHDYIQTITDSYTSVPLYDTPSEPVSALLNTKHQSAAKAGIQFEIDWEFPYIHIDDFAIITILGNLIDNAITAAGKCENGTIYLALKQMDSYLEIVIRNDHEEKIQEKNGEFETTKTDQRFFHGIGIKNVRSAVENLNGQLEIQYTDETFEVHVLVPNY